MRIHCLCLVRDEADILRHTLDAALRWADGIYVIDNGSTDGSWEILAEYAGRFPQVRLVGRDDGPFRTTLRGQIARSQRGNARRGDWWCRLDADEIYVDDPRSFLASVDRQYDLVFATSIHYYFTDVDLAAYEQDPARFVHEWQPQLLRYYLANWSEPRFVRHMPWAKWFDEWPVGFWHMSPAPKRIRLRHYQYRSPPQIARRLEARIARTQKGRFSHEKTDHWLPAGLRAEDLVFPRSTRNNEDLWRSRLVRSSALHRDDGGTPHVDPALLPPLWIRPSRLRRSLAWLRHWR